MTRAEFVATLSAERQVTGPEVAEGLRQWARLTEAMVRLREIDNAKKAKRERLKRVR